jgi:hypothetical protein
MGWVRNVVLMSVYFGSEKPQGVGISGRGPDGRVRECGGQFTSNPKKRWTDPVTARRFQVSGKGNKGSKGNKASKGIMVYITYPSCVYNGMIAAVNDTSCIFA